MSDIKNYEAIEWALECMNHYSECDIPDEDRVAIAEAKTIISTFITTIESQKEEIATLCPIGDFDIITSLRAEKEHMKEQIELLQEELEEQREISHGFHQLANKYHYQLQEGEK